jgi:hypothetical protein
MLKMGMCAQSARERINEYILLREKAVDLLVMNKMANNNGFDNGQNLKPIDLHAMRLLVKTPLVGRRN